MLNSILAAQRLDAHNIEGIHHIYDALLTRQLSGLPPDAPLLQQQWAARGSPSPVFEAASRSSQAGEPHCAVADTSSAAEHQSALSSLTALPQADQLAALRNYLIAASAKDCSIMIALQASQPTDLAARSDLTVSDASAPRAMDAPRATGRFCMPDGTVITFKVRCCAVRSPQAV